LNQKVSDSPAGEAAASEERRAAEQLTVDLMAFRRGVEERVKQRLPGHLAIRLPLLIGMAILLMSWLQRHWQAPLSGMRAGGAGALAA